MKISHIIVLLISVALLAACGSQAEATPTPDVNALYTAAAQTIIAETTQTAAAWTVTPQPTPTETEAFTPTPEITSTPEAPTAEGLCDDSAFVTDVTIPDGYNQLTPGQEFTKTWRLKNTGTCPWAPTYQIVYGYGDQMNGNKATSIGVEVPPGAEVEITLTLVAPTVSGSYTGYWRMANTAGAPFGIFFSVSITIP